MYEIDDRTRHHDLARRGCGSQVRAGAKQWSGRCRWVALADVDPENGWSLFGLAQALEAQGKKEQAAAVRERLQKAWQHADVTITSARILRSVIRGIARTRLS